PVINISNVSDFSGNVDLKEFDFSNLNGGNGLYVYGLEDSFSDSNSINENIETKLRVETPNVNLTNMKAKVININNNYAGSASGNVTLNAGKITTSLGVNLYGIPGSASVRNIWTIMDKFSAGTTGSDSGSISSKLTRRING
ncbi:MAG: hypothetical protein IJ638_03065, partial [Alphaproteobacteria bacterium]|nr:hypothetical protein [Alphaproteobacteria bacterium]